MRILILLLMLISCSAPTPLSDNLNRVGGKAARYVERELPLTYDGIGRMVQNGKIKFCTIRFDYPNPMTIQEGRNLILTCFKTSLATFQQDQAIQPYLLEQPFCTDNLNIFIYINSFSEIETPPNLVTSLSIVRGIIQYDRFDLQSNRFVTIYEETYEEALQKCTL